MQNLNLKKKTDMNVKGDCWKGKTAGAGRVKDRVMGEVLYMHYENRIMKSTKKYFKKGRKGR
jgi:hypothetical protein